MPALVSPTGLVFPVATGREGYSGAEDRGRTGNACPIDPQFGDTWGATRGRGTRHHTGVDIFAGRGTNVLAIEAGKIQVSDGQNSGIGRRLVADSGRRWSYSHLDEGIPAGRVRAGQRIGSVGNTGSARGTCPHLHLELREPGSNQAVNPYSKLVAMRDGGATMARQNQDGTRAELARVVAILNGIGDRWERSTHVEVRDSVAFLRQSLANVAEMAVDHPDAALRFAKELVIIMQSGPAEFQEDPGALAQAARIVDGARETVRETVREAGRAASAVAAGGMTGGMLGLAVGGGIIAWMVLGRGR